MSVKITIQDIKDSSAKFMSKPKTRKELADAWVLSKGLIDKQSKNSEEYKLLDKWMKYLDKWRSDMKKAELKPEDEKCQESN